MSHFLKIFDANGDTLFISARWTICPVCEGEGKHSHAIGCITASDFEEEWETEEREAYFAGAYDRRCSDCDGSGKVLEPDFENITVDELKAWNSYNRCIANDRAEREADRRMGC